MRHPHVKTGRNDYQRVTLSIANVIDTPYFRNQQIAPVIAKAQFVFSLSFGSHPSLPESARPGNAALPNNDPNKDFYITWLVVDPGITLWNPYNVNLRFPAGRIDLYRVPLTFRLYKNGTLINSEYTHLANCFLENQFANRRNTFYRLNLLPERNESEIVMAPGEHLVFTASNHVKTFNNEFSNLGLDLRPGFSPPAGNASNSEVGGVSILNVCVSPTGDPNGRDYGKDVRTIAVKPGDVVQVEVQQGRAAVDSPPETGGKEVSGFLKYYIGDPSSPSLVGGIELDYGDQESEFLPSYSINDLPAFGVSDEIPRWVKADEYLGQNPPIVARFKEPFLISTFQLKTERDSRFPSRGWINNSPVNLYASAGIDQQESWPHHQYELQWEVMTDWPPSSPTIEISNTNNRGYGGPGTYAQSGTEFATHSTIPTAPALSLAQLRHAPLNTGGLLPLTSQVVANSFAPPLLDSPFNVNSTRVDVWEAILNSTTTNPVHAVENGNTVDGSPGILTQADILTAIAPTLSARGDTFTSRAYGQAGPLNGGNIKVWCEAVVQRIPEYLDPDDEPWLEPTLPANQLFGRRYELVSFRWLSPDEI